MGFGGPVTGSVTKMCKLKYVLKSEATLVNPVLYKASSFELMAFATSFALL